MSSGLPGYFWFSLLLFSLGERMGGWGGGGDIGKELFPFMFADVHALGAKKMSDNGTLTDDGGPFVVFQTSMGKTMLILGQLLCQIINKGGRIYCLVREMLTG